MQFIKKLSDWKIWLFAILPIILLAFWLSVMIYCYVNSSYNALIIVSTQALFPIACILMNSYSLFFQIKQKHYIRGIASIALMLCFLGLQITIMVFIPKLIELSQEEQSTYQIYKETSYDDDNYSERQNAWRTANKKSHDLNFKMQFISYGSMFAFIIGEICSPTFKQKNEDNNENGNINK